MDNKKIYTMAETSEVEKMEFKRKKWKWIACGYSVLKIIMIFPMFFINILLLRDVHLYGFRSIPDYKIQLGIFSPLYAFIYIIVTMFLDFRMDWEQYKDLNMENNETEVSKGN